MIATFIFVLINTVSFKKQENSQSSLIVNFIRQHKITLLKSKLHLDFLERTIKPKTTKTKKVRIKIGFNKLPFTKR